MPFYIQSEISNKTCIGNTLSTFNINFSSLDTNLEELSSYSLLTHNFLSSEMGNTSSNIMTQMLYTSSSLSNQILYTSSDLSNQIDAITGFTIFQQISSAESPNNSISVHAFSAYNPAHTNIDIVFTAAGNGSFGLSIPDGDVAGGNKRGRYSVDLQKTRDDAPEVASGDYSVIAGGTSNKADSIGTFVGGGSANYALSSYGVVVGGHNNTVSAAYSFIGGGSEGITYLRGQHTQANGGFAASTKKGDAQYSRFILKGRSTTNSPINLYLDHPTNTEKLVIPENKVWDCTIKVTGVKTGQTGTLGEVAYAYKRIVVKNIGGTVSTVGSVQDITTIPTNEITEGTPTYNIHSNNTDKTLDVEVTGISTVSIRWVAVVEVLELGYDSEL